jgi:carboxypeptidase Taq
MTNTIDLYDQYSAKLKKIADVKYAAAVLQWDQETYLPLKGASARSRQLATLNELAHRLFTDTELENLLQELHSRDDLDFKQKRNVELTLEEYGRQQKFSSAFVRRMSEAVSTAFYAWIDSRKQNDFPCV